MTEVPTPDGRRIPRQYTRAAIVTPGPGGRNDAQTLWNRVEETRGHTAELRRVVTTSRTSLARSRFDCLDALQAYAACLTADHRPLPYRLRDEIQLLLLTCATDSRY